MFPELDWTDVAPAAAVGQGASGSDQGARRTQRTLEASGAVPVREVGVRAVVGAVVVEVVLVLRGRHVRRGVLVGRRRDAKPGDVAARIRWDGEVLREMPIRDEVVLGKSKGPMVSDLVGGSRSFRDRKSVV